MRVLDGPYADTREQLGGFHLIEVADREAAVAWARRSPTALHGAVEVRAVMDGTMLTRDWNEFLMPAQTPPTTEAEFCGRIRGER